MKKLKRLSSFSTASVLAVSALLSIGFAPSVNAAADTCTWIATSDSNFNNAANWSGCDGAGVPEAVDTIRFTTNGNSQTLTNDLGYEVAGVEVAPPVGVGGTGYTIDTLTIASNGTIVDQGEGGAAYINVSFTNLITQGDLTISGGTRLTAANWTVNGVVTLEDGAIFAGEDVSPAGIIVRNGATLSFEALSASPSTGTFPITLGGGAGTDAPVIEFPAYYSGSFQDTAWTFANPLTLAGNALVMLNQEQVTVNQTGSITGPGFTLGLHTSSAAGSRLIINPASNNSATVAGTYTGSGAGAGSQGGASPDEEAPEAPDTGFALAANNPVTSALLIIAAAGGIALIARRLQTSSSKSHK